jgi:hypothetical protein
MSTTDTYIYEDKGDKNDKEILWYSLDGSTTKICPFGMVHAWVGQNITPLT